jgi:hypothetical protein
MAPNWMDRLIRRIDLCHGNDFVTTHDLPDFLMPHLNFLLYSFMTPELKQRIAPHPGNPANMIGNEEEDLLSQFAPKEEKWHDYFKHLSPVTEKPFSFDYIPLNVFPFFQKPYFDLVSPQQDLPMNHIGKMYVRISFIDDYSAIIHTADRDDAKKYKLIFTGFQLVLEEERVPPHVKIPRNNIEFVGHSLSARFEPVPKGALNHRIRFLRAAMPEQILFFGIRKKVLAGKWRYSDHFIGAQKIRMLEQLHIKSIDTIYNGNILANKSPHFGDFDQPGVSGYVLMNALLTNGLLKFPVNPSKVTIEQCIDFYQNTVVPFYLLDFTLQDGSKCRIQPPTNDINSPYLQDGMLELEVKYLQPYPEDILFISILLYSGVNLTLNVKDQKMFNAFSSQKKI